ncbi:hypothetical protein SBDP1_1220005 [Syntrophobacter sp. SbD1]|nr:hypothetical protein SBDP1_1220005 [Syntrophobacter sp. SbD1]
MDTPSGHYHSIHGRNHDRSGCDPHAGNQPGGAQFRSAVRDYSADHIHTRQSPDGSIGQSPGHHGPDVHCGGPDFSFKRVPDISGICNGVGNVQTPVSSPGWIAPCGGGSAGSPFYGRDLGSQGYPVPCHRAGRAAGNSW